MKKNLFRLTSILLISALALSACSSKAGQSQQSNNTGTTTAPAKSENKTVSDAAIKDGTAKLLKTAKQLNKAATAGIDAKIKELGPQLEEAWASFEDGVKPKYPNLYEQMEKNLNPIVAASKASPINKEDVLKLDNQLLQVLYDLSQKLIPVDQVKAGAVQMIGINNDLKKEIEAGNEAKVKELGSILKDTWATFEDGVSPRNAGLYEKIEKSLNPEVAGSQKSPMDKQALSQLNEGLTQALNELLQTIK
jgi:iron uptake system EfeUOB component EfeO/EfeM